MIYLIVDYSRIAGVIMEIKNGLVQYGGRNDIPCTYIEMEDGTKYYVKQDLTNGNRIVTTSLLEAVDPMAKAQNIGLMNNEGNVILACNNSSIKTINGDILLVEPAEAVSDNVKEANSLRMDPLSATRLVSTPAQIKEKINAKISSDGRYVLNDQFKDGTLCDAYGNNLVNNEYYSFVAIDGDKVFMAKNYPETDITEFSIPEKKIVNETPVVENNEIEIPTAETTPVVEETPVVENNVVEVPTQEVAPVTETTEVAAPVVNINEGFAREDVDLNQGTEVAEEVTDLGEEVSIPTDNVSFDEIPEEITPAEVAETVAPTEEENVVMDEEDNYEKATDLEERLNALNAKFEGMNQQMSKFEETTEAPVEEYVPQDIEEDEKEEDAFANSEVQVDSIDDIEDEDIDETYDISEDVKDTTMEDATKALSDLAQKYTDKENELAEALEREEKLKISRKNYMEKSKAQEQKINLINSKNHDLIDANNKLEAKVESLNMSLDLQKRKGEEQKRTINELSRENERLRSQLEGKEELARALESVRAIIGDNDSYNEEDSYYKVA